VCTVKQISAHIAQKQTLLLESAKRNQIRIFFSSANKVKEFPFSEDRFYKFLHCCVILPPHRQCWLCQQIYLFISFIAYSSLHLLEIRFHSSQPFGKLCLDYFSFLSSFCKRL
jgi:hypothetical protein